MVCCGVTQIVVCSGVTQIEVCCGVTQIVVCSGVTQILVCCGVTQIVVCCGVTRIVVCCGVTQIQHFTCVASLTTDSVRYNLRYPTERCLLNMKLERYTKNRLTRNLTPCFHTNLRALSE